MRPTINTSAASCRHIIALPWKHKSYLPTSRANSQTNCKKGSFQIRSSVVFSNHWISQRATVPGQYFLVFFTLPAWRNSFWGALPPTVGWIFLLTGSSLPNIDGPASAAIWAKCWVSDNKGDLPTSLSCPASAILLMISSACRGASLAGVGNGLATRASSPFLPSLWLSSSVVFVSLHLSSCLGVTFVLAILEGN